MGFRAVGFSSQPLSGTPWVTLYGSFSAPYFFDSTSLAPSRQYYRITSTSEGYWQDQGFFGASGQAGLVVANEFKEADISKHEIYTGDWIGRRRWSTRYGVFDGSSKTFTAEIPSAGGDVRSDAVGCGVEAMVSGTVEFLPNPAIYLGSKDDDQSNYRNVQGQRVYNAFDRNMDRSVDIAARFQSDGAYTGWVGGALLDGTYGAIANKAYQWFYSGTAASNGQPATNQSFALSTRLDQGGDQTLGGTTQMILNIDDADWSNPTTLESNLTIRWHFPYENWVQTGASVHSWETPPDFRAASSPVSANSSVTCTWTDGPSFYKLASQYDAAKPWLKVVGFFLPGAYSTLLNAAGIARDFVPQSHSENANPDQAWNNLRSTFPSGSKGDRSLYRVAYAFDEGYIAKDWRGESYSLTGFEGMVVQATKKRNGFEGEWRGNYSRDRRNEGGGDGPGPTGSGDPQPGAPGGGGPTTPGGSV